MLWVRELPVWKHWCVWRSCGHWYAWSRREYMGWSMYMENICMYVYLVTLIRYICLFLKFLIDTTRKNMINTINKWYKNTLWKKLALILIWKELPCYTHILTHQNIITNSMFIITSLNQNTTFNQFQCTWIYLIKTFDNMINLHDHFQEINQF